MEQLYILQLENGKYYVGKSNDVQKRFREHKSGSGSAWTSEYKPIKILETRPITSVHDETNVTKDLMKKHGIDNVRGGAYTKVNYTDEVKDVIKMELRSSNDACYKCGKPGHYANQCKRKSSFKAMCSCGEEYLDMDEFMSHIKSCKVRNKQIEKTPKSGSCYRCGRKGHWANNCYARTDVDGDDLDSDSD
jgi:predicted GIY-YIG superfamily endonuclease